MKTQNGLAMWMTGRGKIATGVMAAVLMGTCGLAVAQPRIVVLNPGAPSGVSNDGTKAFGGSSAYGVGLSSISIGVLSGTSPSATSCSDDGMFAAGTVGGAASRWSVAGASWTNAPLATTITGISNVRDISSTGQFIVGQCSTSSPGSIAGYVTDYGVTPAVTTKLLGTTTTARATGVSADGTVIVGGESPSTAGTTSGGRPGVWRWNPGTNVYDWSYLPDGPSSSGGVIYRTVDNFQINDAGTVIVGNSFKHNAALGIDQGWLTRWTWNAGTQQWDRADLYNIDGGALTISSWWTPLSGCTIPPRFTPTAMTDDGNTIVGLLEYSTCGSFIRGGFILTAGEMRDLYDHLVSSGVDLTTAGYGPYTASGFGLCHLGYAFDISDDGNTLVGAPSLDPDTPGAWLIDLNRPGAGCIQPVIASNPANTNFTACTNSMILNASAAGSAPMAMTWTKNGNPIAEGPSGTGSTYQILALGKQLRINAPLSPSDAGTYAAVAINACGAAPSTGAIVQVDPAVPVASNDTCGTAQSVVMGTNVLGTGQSPCGAWVEETWGVTCAAAGVKRDRWYVFTPTVTQEYRLETCGANYDTVLTMYSDCSGSELACSNDYTTGPSTGCSSNRSRIGRVALTSGTPYLIRISAPSSASLSASSLMNLSIMAAPAAASNDECSSAAVAVTGANAFDTTEASPSMTVACNTTASRDVFFNYTAPSTGTIRVSTCPGTTWNTVVSIHAGSCGTELACNDNANITGCSTQSVIDNFTVVGGTTYQIRVGGNSATAFGAGVLTITFNCYANCDGSSGNPLLTANDFQCFINKFAGNDAYANCDSSTGTPALTANDFQCFINKYAGGCGR